MEKTKIKKFWADHWYLISALVLLAFGAAIAGEEGVAAAEVVNYRSPEIDYGIGVGVSLIGISYFLAWGFDRFSIISKRRRCSAPSEEVSVDA